jgi:hypothetical protein
VVLLKSIIGKNAAKTSVINGPNQQDHAKKIYIPNTGNISTNSCQKLKDDTTMKAEVLKDTILNNTIKESKPTPDEKQITSQMLIFLF